MFVNCRTISVSRKRPHSLALLQPIEPVTARAGGSHWLRIDLCFALPVQPAPDPTGAFGLCVHTLSFRNLRFSRAFKHELCHLTFKFTEIPPPSHRTRQVRRLNLHWICWVPRKSSKINHTICCLAARPNRSDHLWIVSDKKKTSYLRFIQDDWASWLFDLLWEQ